MTAAREMMHNTTLHIGGRWCSAEGDASGPVFNPATGEQIGVYPKATQADLERAVSAAELGFKTWRDVAPFDRYKIMRKAAELMRERMESIAQVLTTEEGKPLHEARLEPMGAADIIDWFAEEGRRAYGRVIPARSALVNQATVKEPVGPTAAFTPWNFPLAQAAKKIAPALAAGCSVIIKAPEETPATCSQIIKAFEDAGLPGGVLNLVYGVPADISQYLISHPTIRKISFTGSTAVGSHLAAMAGKFLKRATMELGGHCPAVIFEDADIDLAVSILAAGKFRNAGQICNAPSRFIVHEAVYEVFVEKFSVFAKSLRVGNGLEPGTQMGPVANLRRLQAMQTLVADAVDKGARIRTGGERIGNRGCFFQPTVLTEVPQTALLMNEEPFGPVAPIARFQKYEEAVSEANRLSYGLAAYAYTRSARTAAIFARDCDTGMVSINHQGLAIFPETPFGGIKSSGYGHEGGMEGLEAYLQTKFITQANPS
jgi:succinate-semialdehyde dehydrogenase / glutarate-semialdehyde dehydrogenase